MNPATRVTLAWNPDTAMRNAREQADRTGRPIAVYHDGETWFFCDVSLPKPANTRLMTTFRPRMEVSV